MIEPPPSSITSRKSEVQALISEVKLFACTIATVFPLGVATISIDSLGFESGFSSTTIANALVPAETLPVFTLTAFVATIPVPASPSGGHILAPDFKVPVGSSKRAPASVSVPASSPAISGAGSKSSSFLSTPCDLRSELNISSLPLSYSFSIVGNIPAASPMPSTLLPLSCQ